jgi:hypothetical protein
VDVKTYCFKLLGEHMTTRAFDMPVANIQTRAAILNLFIVL